MLLRNLTTPVKQGLELTHLQLLLCLLVIELPSYQPLCGIHGVEWIGDRLHANIIVKRGTETCQQCAHRGFAFLCFAEGQSTAVDVPVALLAVLPTSHPCQ